MDGVVSPFADMLSRGWKDLLLRGIAAIAFGLLAWMKPGMSLLALIFLFGIYAFVDGILAAWTGIRSRKVNEKWWVLLLVGLAGIAVGIITFISPVRTAFSLLVLIALWAIARGVIEIAAGFMARKEIEGEWVLVLAGVVSVLFGAILISHPAAGALGVLWLIGAYAVLGGILLVVLAFKVRSLAHRHQPA